MESQIERINNSIPAICSGLEDCWNCAVIAISAYLKIDYYPLFLGNVFFYSKEPKKYKKKVSFETVVNNSVVGLEVGSNKLSIDKDMIDKIIVPEVNYLKNYLGIVYDYKFCSNEGVFRTLLKSLNYNKAMIVWIDTYECPWNPMYRKFHFPHCFVLYESREEYATIFDALYQNHSVQVKLTDFITNVYFLNILSKGEKHKCITDMNFAEFVKEQSEMSYKGEDILLKNESNLKLFIDDIKGALDFFQENEEISEECVKLVMRIFTNSYQKSKLFHESFIKYFKVSNEIKVLFKEEEDLWKNTGNLLVKLLYVPNCIRMEKKEILYQNLELLVKSAEKKRFILIEK